eukprot:gb/GECH01014382.1/.p1 GENE.gb/GECH01014382.1/~~gb/GECH01014382.1/.p1  ORF type:complete len:286 (+),score=77.36 gb/GECH01014382.1/:1-858(+)
MAPKAKRRRLKKDSSSLPGEKNSSKLSNSKERNTTKTKKEKLREKKSNFEAQLKQKEEQHKAEKNRNKRQRQRRHRNRKRQEKTFGLNELTSSVTSELRTSKENDLQAKKQERELIQKYHQKMTSDKKKHIVTSEVNQFKNVLQDPSFQNNPLSAIKEHVSNTNQLNDYQFRQQHNVTPETDTTTLQMLTRTGRNRSGGPNASGRHIIRARRRRSNDNGRGKTGGNIMSSRESTTMMTSVDRNDIDSNLEDHNSVLGKRQRVDSDSSLDSDSSNSSSDGFSSGGE